MVSTPPHDFQSPPILSIHPLHHRPSQSLISSDPQVASLVSRFQTAADRNAVATARDAVLRRASFQGRRVSMPADDAVAAAATGAAALAQAAATVNPAAVPTPTMSNNDSGDLGDGTSEPSTDRQIPSEPEGAEQSSGLTAPMAPRGPIPLAPVAPNIPTEEKPSNTQKHAPPAPVAVLVPAIVDIPPTPVEQHVAVKKPPLSKRTKSPGASRAKQPSSTAPKGTSVDKKPLAASHKTVRPRPSTSRLTAAPRTSSSVASAHVSAHSPEPTSHSEPLRAQGTGASHKSHGHGSTSHASGSSPSKPTAASLAKARPRASSPLSPDHTGASSTTFATPRQRSRSSLSTSPPAHRTISTPPTSRLLQGTAASRARAAATAASSPSAKTPPKSQASNGGRPRSSLSPTKGPNRSPKAVALGTGSSPSKKIHPRIPAEGKSPIGRIGLAAAREAPKAERGNETHEEHAERAEEKEKEAKAEAEAIVTSDTEVKAESEAEENRGDDNEKETEQEDEKDDAEEKDAGDAANEPAPSA